MRVMPGGETPSRTTGLVFAACCDTSWIDYAAGESWGALETEHSLLTKMSRKQVYPRIPATALLTMSSHGGTLRLARGKAADACPLSRCISCEGKRTSTFLPRRQPSQTLWQNMKVDDLAAVPDTCNMIISSVAIISMSCSVEFDRKIMSHLLNTVEPRSWESAWPKSCSEMDRVSSEDPGSETRLDFRWLDRTIWCSFVSSRKHPLLDVVREGSEDSTVLRPDRL